MFIKRILGFLGLTVLLAGCTPQVVDWNAQYGAEPTGKPSQIQNSFHYPEYELYGRGDEFRMYTPPVDAKNVTVLLPLSGPNSSVGAGIKTSVEMAFLQKRLTNVSVNFHDLSGNRTQKQNIIMNALMAEPDIIIGPVFAEDVRMVRDLKPETLPILSFSSDTNALGNGAMTMALMPAQSVETIILEMMRDGANSVVIMAPQTTSGQLMAGAAIESANLHDMPVAGLFYYKENNSDSIKSATLKASMYTARTAANTKAREILSDIMVKEDLTPAQKESLEAQLEKISKSDTLGKVPYDAVLFLGSGADAKSIASFLRYYDVAARDARFYGTAIWDSGELSSDFTMVGAKFAALPAISNDFSVLYEQVSGKAATRLDTFGFDAANLAIGMLHSSKTPAAYLLDPSGYSGLDGLFRMRPSGISERALQISELTGGGTPRVWRAPATDFLKPIYTVDPRKIKSASEMDLAGPGINPMDYINIPGNLAGKYNSKTFGNNTRATIAAQGVPTEEIIIMPEDDSDIIENPDFQPIKLEQVDQKLIDSIEVAG